MNMNELLKAAFADLDEKQAALKHDDSSAPAEEVSDTEVEQLFTEDERAAHNTAVDEEINAVLHEAGVDTPAPLERKQISIRGLDEKAVLVQLKRSMFGTSKQDTEATAKYGAGNVHKQLFKNNPDMETVKAAYYEVYRFVNDHTVPWAKGVRMLNIDHYFDFTTGLRKRIDDAEQQVDTLCSNWDSNVQWDLRRLAGVEQSKGLTQGTLADPDDYPSKWDIRDKFGIEVRYMPVPTAGDFRVNISDEDKASLQKQLEDAEEAAARHVIQEMMEPMQRAVDKLSVPIGQDGSIFRDSLIDNIVSVAERMERVNLSDDPEVTDKIAELKSLATTYANNKDMLRNAPDVRKKAATQIDDLMRQMKGLV